MFPKFHGNQYKRTFGYIDCSVMFLIPVLTMCILLKTCMGFKYLNLKCNNSSSLCSVPITCMWIINQHVKESSDGVKGNATDVFNILIDFANDTDDVCIYY